MATVHYLDLPKEFANMSIPKEFRHAFGSKSVTKLMTFVDHYAVGNDDYDNLMAMRPQRQNGESAEQFVLRSALQRQFRKHKHLFYDYNVYYPTAKQLKKAKKASLKAQA